MVAVVGTAARGIRTTSRKEGRGWGGVVQVFAARVFWQGGSGIRVMIEFAG